MFSPNSRPNQKHGTALAAVIAVIAVALLVGATAYFMSRSAQPGTPVTNQPSDTGAGVPAVPTDLGDQASNPPSGLTEASFTGQRLAGSQSKLYAFEPADYEAAKDSGQLVVLYFYAKWCPICVAETANALYPAFDSLDSGGVIGFRVNFNDNDTSAEEKALAKEFGVAYQHTKVFVKNGQRLLKSPEQWDTARYLSEIGQYR